MKRWLVCIVLLAALEAAASVSFTADLQTFAGAPANAYVNLVLVNCGQDTLSRPNIPVTTGGALVPLNQLFLPTSEGAVQATIAANSEITCGAVTGETRYRVELRQQAGTTPNPKTDPLLAANEYVIDSDFVLSAAQSPVSPAPATSQIDFTQYRLTRPFRTLPYAQFPASCKANTDRLQRSDPAVAGEVDFVCNASGNGWDLVGDGGSAAGGTALSVNGVAVGTITSTLSVNGVGL